MAKEKDAELMKLYGLIQNCNYSTAVASSAKSDSSYDMLQNELDSVVQSLGLKTTWDDAVSIEINGGLKTGIDGMILSCKTPAGEIISKVGTTVEKLINSIKTYSDMVDSYNSCESELRAMSSSPPSQRDKEGNTNPAYIQWKNAKASLEGKIASLGTDVENWLSSSKSLVGSVRGLMSAIGSEASTVALSSSGGTTELYEGSSVEEFGYGEGYTISGTVVKDENGNIISETYYIKNEAEEIVQTGMITYNDDGTKNIENYIKKPEVPTTKVEIDSKKEDLNGGKYVSEELKEALGNVAGVIKPEIPEELVYLDEDVVPKEESVFSNTDYYPDEDGTGNDFTQNVHKEQTFDDGATVVSDTKTTGSVEEVQVENGNTEKVLVPEESTEKGKITAPSGKVVDFETLTTYERGVRDEATTTLTENGQQVATVNTDYVADYNDKLTGCDVDVKNTVIVTEETTVTDSSVVYKEPSGEIHVDGAVVTRSNDDSSCGSIRYSDGSGYDVTRNENGELVVTEYYEDKHGEIVSDEGSVITSETDSTFSVTSPDGKTVDYKLNMSNPMDEFFVKNEYQTARIDSGYDPNFAMEGCNFLWDGDGDPVSVENPFATEGSGYTFSLQYNGE